MAQSLSTATSSEIEHVTRLCQRLEFFVVQPPLQVRPLSHGESNQSYYVKTAQGEYVLRCYPADSAICRQQELRCQHAAAAKGLAPAPLCLNNHYQVMLSDYIASGEPFNYQRHGYHCLVATLAQYHQLPVQTAELDCCRYLAQLAAAVAPADTVMAEMLLPLQQAAKQLQQAEADTVLCHLDLHAGNLLYAAAKLWLLDFEYSQRADSSLDLAAISLHFNLTAEAIEQMLQQYSNNRHRPDLLATLQSKLPAARLLYSGFCWLWYLTMPGCQQQAQHWQQQVKQLAEVL
ncbi:phosphotransferase [Rheinheimera maricola]|uniref:Phosphotransferase n=1 Tax=Rheinheimera maricola TaxID=2793282 RepID=A0ABS7X7I5_9GAMM|nr:phosphotransferase [Rheinheimera maricola]MBZ9611515.1 phosphotransferase [Rheinheimera maricola]